MIRVPKQTIDAIGCDLTVWFEQYQREMPWRETSEPYAIWISEIMLQQTRVTAVIPYYQRFLATFPTVYDLADAPQDAVLKLWEGLGYYSRARNLQAAAKKVVTEFEGCLPADRKLLQSLPGIGKYTSGAIASIAFGLDEPVLDGNVIRVLTRVFRIHDNPKEADTQNTLWTLARKLIPTGQAGTFNQAMMELGALICLPKNPACETCPLVSHCKASKYGEQSQLPFKAPKKALPHHTIVAAVIFRGRGKQREFLIDRRPEGGMLAGLWEFPGGKVEPGESLEAALRREVREELGAAITVGEKLDVTEHAYSHFRITMHTFSCRLRSGSAAPRAVEVDAIEWITPESLGNYAFPKANHRVVKMLGE